MPEAFPDLLGHFPLHILWRPPPARPCGLLCSAVTEVRLPSGVGGGIRTVAVLSYFLCPRGPGSGKGSTSAVGRIMAAPTFTA